MKHSIDQRRMMVERPHKQLSLSEQCRLLSLHRSGLYYRACRESEQNLHLMKLSDEFFLMAPFTGTRKMVRYLKREQGLTVNRKRIKRLYRHMGLQALTPKPKTSLPGRGHMIYPYLLKGLIIDKPNHVWAADITYIPMRKGFLYMIAIMDLHSRYVLNWRLSNTMDAAWCAEVLREAIARHGRPQIFNTDQGSQFTSEEFTVVLKENNIQISMDGKGRATDNIFVERLWRSLKYEYVYLNPAQDGVVLSSHVVQFVLCFESLSLMCHSLAWSSQRMVAIVCVSAVVPFRSRILSHDTKRLTKIKLKTNSSRHHCRNILCVPSMAQLLSRREISLIIQRVQVPCVQGIDAR